MGGGADDMDGGEAAAAFMMEEAFQVREKQVKLGFTRACRSIDKLGKSG